MAPNGSTGRACRAGLGWLTLLVAMLPVAAPAATTITGTSVSSTPEYTEIVLESPNPVRFSLYVLRNPHRFVLELEGVETSDALEAIADAIAAGNPHVQRLQVEAVGSKARIRLDLKGEANPDVFALLPRGDEPHRLVVDVRTRKAAEEPVKEAWLAIVINGQELEQPALVLRQANGPIRVRGVDLEHWRLHRPSTSPTIHLGEAYYSLDALPGLAYRIDEPRQALLLDVPAGAFFATELNANATPPSVPVPPSPGAFLNYDVSTTRDSTDTTASGLIEAGLFAKWGTTVTRFLSREIEDRTETVRLETTWTLDRPNRLDSLRVGDGTTHAAAMWGGAVRFGGIQWATNFDTRPGLIPFPLPDVSGEARLSSTLDVYVNDALRLRQNVPEGPFRLDDVPVVTGDGEVRVVVRDLLGREQVISRPYYASPLLLRRGLRDYSYELGVVRENFGLESNDYGRAVAVGTHRVGLTDWFTAEVHGELLSDQRTLGVSGVFLWPALGTVSVALAASDAAQGSGTLAGFGLARRTRLWSFGLNGQVTSGSFTHVGVERDGRAPRRMGQAFLNLAMGRYGTVGLSYVHRTRDDEPEIRIAGASYNVTLGDLGLFSVRALRVLDDEDGASVSFSFSRPLGPRTNANVHVIEEDGSRRSLMQLQRNPPAGPGLGYRLASDGSADGRREAELRWQHDFGALVLDATTVAGETRTGARASGGTALLEGDLFAGPRIDGSFAVVSVGDFPGMRVYRDNQLIGRTRRDGRLLLPSLRPYEPNPIGIEQADLPLDAEIDRLRMQAVPYHRSGLLVEFPVRRARGVLLSIVRENGEPVPVGANVEVLGSGEHFPVGLRGEVYLPHVDREDRLRVTWGDQVCALEVSYPELDADEPLPHLGPKECVTAPRAEASP